MNRVLSLALVLGAMSCQRAAPPVGPTAPSADEVRAFLVEAEETMRAMRRVGAAAAWAYATDINDENAQRLSEVRARHMQTERELTLRAASLQGATGLSPEESRQLLLMTRTATTPQEAEDREALAGVLTELSGLYGAGKVCEGEGDAQTCRDLGDLEDVLTASATLEDADQAWADQLDAWVGWRTVSPAMRERYTRFVDLSNRGAQSFGHADLGEAWRSGYDMDPAAFGDEVERLWQQVKPLYEELHCHVRAALSERYGAERVSPSGPIPAHVLGNMWAQSWDNLFPLVAPAPEAEPVDLTGALKEAAYEPVPMVRAAEGFFTGMGLKALPESFWERSMIVQPEGRDVQCHASAWDLDMEGDVRIKMCTKVNGEDFVTIHHELGHIYYYLYYNHLPAVFQTGAHDGFHEGIGDTLALSITPGYLASLGLPIADRMDDDALLNRQMQDALAKIAFLPFGRMIDLWRWGVFSGEIGPDAYNEAWWELRETYQGIVAPVERTEDHFDPGAKYHIPGNTPYMRYFLAHILQFQFHQALCDAAGHEGPLHTCSIAGNEAAGERLAAMLSMGASQPWPDALEAIAGTRQMDAGALLAYFEPLRSWLQTQNEGRTCGW